MKFSVRAQLLILFTVIFALAFAAFAFAFYNRFSDYAVEIAKGKLSSDALSITVEAAASIDANQVEAIRNGDSDARQALIENFEARQNFYKEQSDLELEFSLLFHDQDSVDELVFVPSVSDLATSPWAVESYENEDDQAYWEDTAQQGYSYDIISEEPFLWTTYSQPIFNRDDTPTGGILFVDLRSDNQISEVRRQVLEVVAITGTAVFILMFLVIIFASRRATLALSRLTDASELLDKGEPYQTAILQPVFKRGDEIGQLARVFDRMAVEVQGREEKLKQEVVKLKIEIDRSKQAQQVSEIVDSDFFQDLKAKKEELRKTNTRPPSINDVKEDTSEDDYLANLTAKAKKMKSDSDPSSENKS